MTPRLYPMLYSLTRVMSLSSRIEFIEHGESEEEREIMKLGLTYFERMGAVQHGRARCKTTHWHHQWQFHYQLWRTQHTLTPRPVHDSNWF